MKKTLFFLLLLLLPCFGFSQGYLVRWKGVQQNWAPTANPTYYASNVNATPASGVGINFNSGWNGFEGTNWSASSLQPNAGTYFLFTISPATNYQIVLTKFDLRYKGQCSKMRVSYSKNQDFSNPTIYEATGLVNNQNDTDISIPLTGPDATITSGSTLYVRVYGYQSAGGTWALMNGQGNSDVGPAFFGTVLPYVSGVYTTAADSATTTETQPISINILGNDTAGTTTLTSINASTASHGTVTVNGTTNVTYTAVAGYTGTDSFTYTVTNASGVSNSSTVSITVNPFPSPTANADTASTGQNIPVTIPVTSNDVAGSGTITGVTITGQPASGSAIVSGSNIIYTPTASFTGNAVISYTVTNSNNKVSNITTATVTVVAITPAIANNGTVSTSKNNAVTINMLNYITLGNSALNSIVITGNPTHGNAAVNILDNTVTYTPNTNYTGADSFTYKITDGYNTTSTATISLSVLQPTTTGALCGTYVISATTQYEYPQFPTITAAVAHLNANGVSCPVTFLLMDNNYNTTTGETFPITINSFTGSNVLTNTVTFKPGPARNVRIEAFRDPVIGGYTPVFATFKIVGADNIIFDGSNVTNGTTRNLTLVNSSYVGNGEHSVNSDTKNRTVLWITNTGSNGANNITVKYCNIRQTYKNSLSNFCMAIYSGGDSMESSNQVMANSATAANSNLMVKNNDFMNVKQGVYVNSDATLRSSNIVITQNDLGSENNEETIIQPAHLNNVYGFEFSENLIYNLRRETTAGSLVSAGFYVTGNSSNGTIVKNNMRELLKTLDEGNYFAGIVLQSSDNASNITVANNFILNVAGLNVSNYKGSGHGIAIVSGGGYKIYHNSVVLNTSQSGSGLGYSAALYVESGTALDVRNNIFVNNQSNTSTRRSAIAVKANYTSVNNIFSYLDYNSYFSADKIAFIANQWSVNDIESPGSPDYLTVFSSWQSLTGKDAHSYEFNPTFLSATDLHLASSNSTINNTGFPLAAVTKDIDGQLRSTSGPDIGADEFGAITIPVTEDPNAGIYCTSSTTWNGTSWSNGNPASDKDVIFRANKTYTAEDMSACSIFVENGAHVNFISESNAYVTHNVNVEEGSTLTFESSSNLIQIENTQNVGNVTIKRNSSKLKRLDYVMWGSPVSGDQTLLDFSPETLTNRFYTYNTLSNLYSVVTDPSATTFTKAKGYLIRMPNTHPVETPTVFQGVFEGVPNNGNVYYPLTYTSPTTGFNAIGNPYPSPISITAFIDANIDNIQGTLWVWRKTNDYTQSSYCTMTKTGYTANAAPGGSSADNDLVADPFELAPGIGVLNTAQGFIVKAKSSLKNVVFRNNMRMDINYSNFFRSAENTPAAQYEWSRIWLNVKGAANDFSQALIAYSSQTSVGYDDGFDGTALTGANIDLSSIITENGEPMKLAIQARPSFTNTDVVQLGFTVDVAGTYSFEIDHVDGVFSGDQNIYIVDNLTNTMHNLKESNYSFSTEVGTFDERFEIVYATAEELGTDIPALDAKDIIVYRDGKQISIKSPKDIKSVTVYDMLGRTLYTNNNVAAAEFVTSNLDTAQQVVIVQIAFDDQQVVSKKIIMN